MAKFYFIFFVAAIIGCKNRYVNPSTTNLSSQSGFIATEKNSGIYKNGTYCAILKYYDPNTEVSSSCSLLVEIENDQLIHISRSDCQSFDAKNFTAKELNKTGSISFTNDRGTEYTITVDETDPLGVKKFQCDICGKDIN